MRPLGNIYIHELTVQGRLSDEFKYAALALILNNPYPINWSIPFFEAPWGAVAPLVHDGGNTELGLNPLWKNIAGRTDFLQRIAVVYKQDLEKLEGMTPEQRSRYPIDILVLARSEQEERDRLTLEGKFFQRAALCFHAQNGNAPSAIPYGSQERLTAIWQAFREEMSMLLGEYDALEAAEVTWFNSVPKKMKDWEEFGYRHEADWLPIQDRLINLEKIKWRHPELKDRIQQILNRLVEKVDREIGILPPKE